MLLAINPPVCPAPGGHSQRGLLTRGATYGSRSARRRNGYSAWGGNGSGQKWDFRQWGGHLAGNPLGVLPKATALTTPYLAFTFYPSWPYWNHQPLPPTTYPYAPPSTTHLYHLYHLYYPGGEMPKKVHWSKAKCVTAPNLWDLDNPEAWRGHPLAKKPRTVRASALCADCPLIRDCAVYALTATPRMAGVVMAGVDIPIAGGAKARAARNQLREIAYG